MSGARMTSPEQITTIVFDLGNVLVRWDPYGPFAGRLPAADAEAFLVGFDFMAFNHLQDAGRTWADARIALAAEAPEHVDALDVYVEHFADTLRGPVAGMAEVVRDLADAGIRLLGLTNWPAETFHLAQPAAPAIGLLEDVLVSGREGVAKPDAAIFALLVERYGLDPRRTIFVDDAERNVAAAAAAGLEAIHFVAADELRAQLVAHGVPVPRHLTVDGERFAVRRHDRGYAFDWLTGPNPDYGFAQARNDGGSMTTADLEDAIRSFLSMVDPATGYIG
jgi:2-haloacid dehalogenase